MKMFYDTLIQCGSTLLSSWQNYKIKLIWRGKKKRKEK